MGRRRDLRCGRQRRGDRPGWPLRPTRCARRHLGGLGWRHGRRAGPGSRPPSGRATGEALGRSSRIVCRVISARPRRRRWSGRCTTDGSPSDGSRELSPVVFAVASEGDAVARGIVDRLADELVAMATAMLRRLRLTRSDAEIVLRRRLPRHGSGFLWADRCGVRPSRRAPSWSDPWRRRSRAPRCWPSTRWRAVRSPARPPKAFGPTSGPGTPRRTR